MGTRDVSHGAHRGPVATEEKAVQKRINEIPGKDLRCSVQEMPMCKPEHRSWGSASTISVEMMYRCMQNMKKIPKVTTALLFESTNIGPSVSLTAQTAENSVAVLVKW